MSVHLPEDNNSMLSFTQHNYGYNYPDGLDLRPGSSLHERIKTECLSLAMQSRGVMMQRHRIWDAISQKLTAFIPADVADALQNRLDLRVPLDIVVPTAYANYEITLTYLMETLLVEPIFRYEPTEPSDKVGAALYELIGTYHNRRARNFLELYSALQDALRFGLGVIHCRWDEIIGQHTRSRNKVRPSNILPGEFYIEESAGTVMTYKSFEGNFFESIDPYLYFPDTGVPLYKPQTGEFVSWLSPGHNRLKLQEQERTSNGYMFNVKYLQDIDNRSTLHVSTGRTFKVGGIDINAQGNLGTRRPVDILWMYRDIIPAEKGLGDSEELEKWVFGIANDAVVITANKSELDHKRCPVYVMAPEADGHTIMPIARLELSHGMSEVIDFEHNSHVKSIAKILRDNLIIDPGVLNLESLKGGDVFRYLFLKRSAWGLGKIDQAAKQLDVYDPTQNNIRDIQIMDQFAAKVLGTSDQSFARQGRDRVTAEEVRDMRTGNNQRLNKVAAVIYAQTFMDLADGMASHTRQFMEDDVYLRIVGRYRDDLIKEYGLKGDSSRMLVSPEMIDVGWDVSASDVFTANAASANSWIQLYQMLLQNPEGRGRTDMTRVFLHIARLLGERNAHDFLSEPNVKVQSDEAVATGAANGRLVPATEVV